MEWDPIPSPPPAYDKILATMSRELASYVLERDGGARRRFCDVLDRIVTDPGFTRSPGEFRVAILTRAGIAHNWCAVAESSEADLRAALRLLTTGLHVVPLEAVDRARLEYTIGNTLLNLYERSGDPQLLAAALRQAQLSVNNADNHSRLAALCLAGLATVQLALFRSTGDVRVLEAAVIKAQEAVSTGASSPLRARYL